MTHIQILVTPAGDELVVIPRADYERLVEAAGGLTEVEEDAADAVMFATRMAALQAGRDQRLPHAVSAALLQGESLLKALRNWRDMTQMHLAHRTNLAQGYISDLEAGRRKGTPESLRAIAVALDVDPSWLLPSAAST